MVAKAVGIRTKGKNQKGKGDKGSQKGKQKGSKGSWKGNGKDGKSKNYDSTARAKGKANRTLDMAKEKGKKTHYVKDCWNVVLTYPVAMLCMYTRNAKNSSLYVQLQPKVRIVSWNSST